MTFMLLEIVLNQLHKLSRKIRNTKQKNQTIGSKTYQKHKFINCLSMPLSNFIVFYIFFKIKITGTQKYSELYNVYCFLITLMMKSSFYNLLLEFIFEEINVL